MGIAILVILAIGLYQCGKWVVAKALPKRDVAAATDSCVAEVVAQQVQSEAATPVEQSWAGYETPTFIRRGIPFPVLEKKVKVKRARKPKLNAAPATLEEAFPIGDWTLFATTEGGHHVATH